MVNFINVINKNDSEFVETINNIDTSKNIIIASHTYEKHISYDSMRRVSFQATSPISFTNYTTIGECAVYEYRPKIKMCHPIGVEAQFIEPYDVYYYNKIYTNNSIYFSANCVLYDSITTVLYIDRILFKQFKKPMSINTGAKILSLNFTYNINMASMIENIYYIQDNFVFENFLDHFSS